MNGLFGEAGCQMDRRFLGAIESIALSLRELKQMAEEVKAGQDRGSTPQPGEGQAEASTQARPSTETEGS